MVFLSQTEIANEAKEIARKRFSVKQKQQQKGIQFGRALSRMFANIRLIPFHRKVGINFLGDA